MPEIKNTVKPVATSVPNGPVNPPVTMGAPVLTSKNLSQGPLRPRITADELDDSITARSLATPDFIDVKKKNPNLSFRWINWKAGDGLRYSQALAQGWVNATAVDCSIAGDSIPQVYQKEGKIINGDLILMKIDRARYLGALKNKHNQALHLAGHGGHHQEAARRVGTQIGSVPAHAVDKVEVFQPSAADLQKISSLGTEAVGE